MNKTAIIMSELEAMALPLKDRPLCYRLPSKMYHDIFEAVGSASMCWNPRPGAEVFDSDEASKVAVGLCFMLSDELERVISEKTQQLQSQLTAALEDGKRLTDALSVVKSGDESIIHADKCCCNQCVAKEAISHSPTKDKS